VTYKILSKHWNTLEVGKSACNLLWYSLCTMY